MKASIVGAVLAAVVVFAATASGAPPTVTLASPGPTPFAGCTADQAAAQQAAGSTL
jgi:hypothetical protein